MTTLLAIALFGASTALADPHVVAAQPQPTPASLEAACVVPLDPVSRQESVGVTGTWGDINTDFALPQTDRTSVAQPQIDPILCVAIIAAKHAACCAVCKEQYPFEYIKSCGWSGGCVRGECVCEHYPL